MGIAIYEIVSVFVIQFHHANIQLPEGIDRFLRKIIVTPSLHKVHHSDWQPETDSNFEPYFLFGIPCLVLFVSEKMYMKFS